MNMMKSIIKRIVNKKRFICTIVVSLLGAWLITIVSLIRDNIPYTLLEDLDFVTYLRFLSHGDESGIFDDAVFIDISNYPDLVKTPTDSAENAQTVITNRDSLLQFLNKVDTVDFEYLFIDVYFEHETQTESGKKLANKIAQMNRNKERVLVCRNMETKDDSSFRNNSAPNCYYLPRLSTNHTRCMKIYIGQDSIALKQLSVPLRIYNSLHEDTPVDIPDKWKHYSIFGHKIAIPDPLTFRNCPITYIPFGPDHDDINSGVQKDYHDLSKVDLKKLIGRIVFVGDMQKDDMHDTYARTISGPYLTYLQYKAIEKQGKASTRLYVCGIFIIYFFVISVRLNWSEIRKRLRIVPNFVSYFKNKRNSVFLNMRIKITLFFLSSILTFLKSFIGYTVIFGLVSIFLLTTVHIVFSTLVPALFLSMMEWLLETIQTYKNKRNRILNINTAL